MSAKKLTKCVACDSHDLEFFLDLDSQPLNNNFHDGDGAGSWYPLGLNVCKNCWHTQIPWAVSPELMFEDYIYVTGTSQTMRDYNKWFANLITHKEGVRISNILDIGSNDGTQLDYFKELGFDTYGVDPAKNLCEEYGNKGHQITNAFWPVDLNKKFDVIIAQNVFAHTPTPLDFLIGIKNHLSENGKAFIQTSQSQMYQRNEFDTTYHEHVSFFSTNSMKTITARAGLVLTDVEMTTIHGDSYLFTVEHEGATPRNSVKQWLDQEASDGRTTLSFYHNFAKNANALLTELRYTVDLKRHSGIKVVGYGAAAKGITVLNSRDIVLDWIVDDNPRKQNKYTPKTNIPVKDRSSLDVEEDLIIIPLAWNFFEEIKSKVEEIRKDKKTSYLTYFPEVEIVE